MAGHVRKRGDKWYYSFETAGINGKRKRIERVGGRTKKEAEQSLRKAIDEYEGKGTFSDEIDISFSDFLDQWYQQHVKINCRLTTQKAYQSLINNHLKPSLGSLRLKSISPALLQNFINEKFTSGLSKSTLTSLIGLLSHSFKYAVFPCQYLKENPVQYIKAPKFEKKANEKMILSKEEFQKIINRYPLGHHYHIPLMIGYYTGLRVGEILSLTWDDIDFDNGFLYVNKAIHKDGIIGPPKTSTSIRKVKIGTTLLNLLRYQKETQNRNKMIYKEYYLIYTMEIEKSDTNKEIRIPRSSPASSVNKPILSFICTRKNGKLINHNNMSAVDKVIKKEFDIPFSFHVLRHTHATLLIEAGANIKDVQKRLGHADISVTLNTYTHQTDEMASQSVELFEKIHEK